MDATWRPAAGWLLIAVGTVVLGLASSGVRASWFAVPFGMGSLLGGIRVAAGPGIERWRERRTNPDEDGIPDS